MADTPYLPPLPQVPSIVEARFAGQALASQTGDVRTVSVERPAEGDPEDDGPISVFESKHHYMAGTLHANGFGHLDRMNARSDPSIPKEQVRLCCAHPDESSSCSS